MPRDVRNWKSESSELAAFDVGPPWEWTTSGGSSPCGATTSGLSGPMKKARHAPAGVGNVMGSAIEMYAGSTVIAVECVARPCRQRRRIERHDGRGHGRRPDVGHDARGRPRAGPMSVYGETPRRWSRRVRCGRAGPGRAPGRPRRSPVGEEPIGRPVELPGGVGELGLDRRAARAGARRQPVDVPPARPVADEMQDAVGRPFRLGDRFVDAARGQVERGPSAAIVLNVATRRPGRRPEGMSGWSHSEPREPSPVRRRTWGGEEVGPS